MTKSIERREGANGVWETVVVDENGGGGSLPDPSGEPDGDVLTVSGGTAVWSPGGGSTPLAARYGGEDTSVNPNVLTPLTLDSKIYGDALLDLSNLLAPEVIEEGWYATSAFISPDENLDAGTYFQGELRINQEVDADVNTQTVAVPVVAALLTPTATPALPPIFIPAGGTVEGWVYHTSATARVAYWALWITKLA